MSPARLERGDLLPRVNVRPPGPRSLELAPRMARHEAPVVNTLYRGRPSVVWREALGSNVLDVDGNRYIDLTSGFGVAAIGHRHPRVVAAIARQSESLVHGMADVASSEPRVALAERLTQLAPMEEARVFFAISGSDAVEIALETAWLATGRTKFLAFDPAYHGTTLGALAATSRPEFRRPFSPQLNSLVTRLPHGAPARAIESELAAGEHAAVIVEPIVGREGILLPPEGWLSELADLCSRHGTLLIADEIFTGFGRTGSRFACDAEAVAPDLLCCGKALGGGLPIAAVLGRAKLMEAWNRDGEALHTATFLGHPLSCAAALAALDVLESEDLAARAARLGDRIDAITRKWTDLPSVADVRGRGLAWTLELATPEAAATLAGDALAHGLLTLAAGTRLQLAPPLVITEEQLDHALGTLRDLLRG